MTRKILTLIVSLLPLSSFGQDESLRNYDYVYMSNIKSVKFHVEGLLLSSPIVNLAPSAPLQLSFDDMASDYKDFTYSVVHCDANWEPSKLVESEYLKGFSGERLNIFDYSFKTKSIYTHYTLYLPNRDMELTKSGNYLLKIYEDEDGKRLAITRRFMVVDPVVSVIPDVVRPAMVSKGDTHQEIDFSITHKGFEIRNPRQELSVTILQNGRWDNAITDLKPQFSRLEEQIFDYQDKVVFPAGKEFRYVDLRSLKYGTESIQYIDYQNGNYDITLKTDEKRGARPYLEFEDINGNFVIETLDDKDHDLESSYAQVLFSLYSPTEMYGQDVYIFGGFTDWQIKPHFKMVYNPAVSAYVAKVLLKQGYYNYLYAALPAGADFPDLEETEGDSYETRNTYTILVYYRPFSGRYDQLIGAYTFSSRL